jgi:hypothetical protein
MLAIIRSKFLCDRRSYRDMHGKHEAQKKEWGHQTSAAQAECLQAIEKETAACVVQPIHNIRLYFSPSMPIVGVLCVLRVRFLAGRQSV